MRRLIRQIHSDNGGQALILALIFFTIGAILIVPELSLAAGSNNLVKINSENLNASYASNAGVEYGLWVLSNISPPGGNYSGTYKLDGQSSDPPMINGMEVTVTIGAGTLQVSLGNNVYTYQISCVSTDPNTGKTSSPLQAQAVQIQTALGMPPNQYYEVLRQ
jgi:hypothetical protein